MGVLLLNRSSRGISPTDAGRRLVDHATNILDNWEVAKRDVAANAVRPRSQLRLGVPVILSSLVTVPLIGSFESLDPPVDLRIFENLSGYLHEWLKDGRLDLSILFNIEDDDLDSLPMASRALYLVGPRHLAPPGGGTIPVRGLEGLPLILTPRPHAVRRIVEDAAREATYEIDIRAEIDSLSEVKALVERGEGLTVLPMFAVPSGRFTDEFSLRRIVEPELELRALLASWRKHVLLDELDAATDLISEVLTTTVKPSG